jgi:hypothetical protein
MRQLLVLLCIICLTSAKFHPLLRDGGDACESDYNCNEGYETCVEGKCVHKEVFPAKPSEIWGLVAITILMLLCTAGGIGGGVVVAPMCIAFFGFGTKEAIALSGFSILLA